MAIISTEKDQQKLLAALALAMVEQPRASMQELAQAVGIGKATLYRFCRTREQLITQLTSYSMRVIDECIHSAGLESAPPLEALRKLTANSLEQRDISAFLMLHVKPDECQDLGAEAGWDGLLDAFFLRGQQEGVFRIDIPAAALTELWVGILTNMIDAERRGRVARAGLLDLIEHAFLHGTSA